MPLPARCPHCDTLLAPNASHCGACQRPVAGSRAADASAGAKNPWSFSLAELLIGTTYLCILLAVTLVAAEWSIYLWVASAVALARTVWYSVAWKRAGRPFSSLAQALSFAESLLVTVLISAAATVAFLGTCLPLGLTVVRCCSPNHSEFLAGLAWVLGGAAALACGGYLLWRLAIRPVVVWWRGNKPPTMFARWATMADAAVRLCGAMLGSGAAAWTAGWTWMVSLGTRLEQRDERTARIILYCILLFGYIAGAVLGVRLGRRIATQTQFWFWPPLAVAGLGSAALIVLASGALPAPYRDDSGISATLAGVLMTFFVALIMHRVLGQSADSLAQGGDAEKGK